MGWNTKMNYLLKWQLGTWQILGEKCQGSEEHGASVCSNASAFFCYFGRNENSGMPGEVWVLKPSSRIVFGGIQGYCNTIVQPYGNTWIKFWIPANTLKYRQILGIANRTRFYSQYHEIPSATVGNHMGMHQIPLDTFGNPEYSNYLLFKRFLRWTRSKRWRPQTIYKIQIYRQLLLATGYLMGFGSPTSNTEYCQIPPNTIWELAFILLKKVKCQWTVKGPQPFPCHVSLFKFNIKFAKTWTLAVQHQCKHRH